MLMPDSCPRDQPISLPVLPDMVEKAGKVPNYKELRMMAFMNKIGL